VLVRVSRPRSNSDITVAPRRYARRDFILDIAPSLSNLFFLSPTRGGLDLVTKNLFFKSTDVESHCELPARNGVTAGNGRASVGPRARCGPFSSQHCAPTTSGYAY